MSQLVIAAMFGIAAAAKLLDLTATRRSIATIVRGPSRGSAPDCNCFGGLAQTTIGLKALVRNTALGALAAFAVLGSGTPTGGLGWLDDVVISPRVATAVIAVLSAALVGRSWFSWQLLRQNGWFLVPPDAQAAELGGGTVPGAAASGRPGLEGTDGVRELIARAGGSAVLVAAGEIADR